MKNGEGPRGDPPAEGSSQGRIGDCNRGVHEYCGLSLLILLGVITEARNGS